MNSPVTPGFNTSPTLFNIFINDLDDGAEGTLSKPTDTKPRAVADKPHGCAAIQGPQKAGDMGSQVLTPIQQRDMQRPAPGEEQPQAPACDKVALKKRAQGDTKLKVSRPCGKESKQYPGLHEEPAGEVYPLHSALVMPHIEYCV